MLSSPYLNLHQIVEEQTRIAQAAVTSTGNGAWVWDLPREVRERVITRHRKWREVLNANQLYLKTL